MLYILFIKIVNPLKLDFVLFFIWQAFCIHQPNKRRKKKEIKSRSYVSRYRMFFFFNFKPLCHINFPSTAAAIAHELRREISTGRAAVLEATPRLVNLHHQHRPEPSGNRLRGRRMQVHPIQLLSHRHEARLDADAPWKTDALSRGTASDCGHALHYDLFRRSVILDTNASSVREIHLICKLSNCRYISKIEKLLISRY